MPARRTAPPLVLAAACLATAGCGSAGAGATVGAPATSPAATTPAATRAAATNPGAATSPGAATTTAAPAASTPKSRRCGRITVPDTEATATVTLRGPRLPCATVRRVVRTAYGRTVLLAATRTTVRDAGRTFRCRYTPSSGAMVCDAAGRRLRGTLQPR